MSALRKPSPLPRSLAEAVAALAAGGLSVPELDPATGVGAVRFPCGHVLKPLRLALYAAEPRAARACPPGSVARAEGRACVCGRRPHG